MLVCGVGVRRQVPGAGGIVCTPLPMTRSYTHHTHTACLHAFRIGPSFFLCCSCHRNNPKHSSYLFIFLLLGLHPRHMAVPRPGVKLELQLAAYTTATVTWDLSCVCDLHHSSRQRQIPDPLIEPGIEPKSSWIRVGFVSAAPQWELLLLF